MPSSETSKNQQPNAQKEAAILQRLSKVMDPEIPALNVLEMGIVRDVKVDDGEVTVSITPTYSGCPAMDMISQMIRAQLAEAGYDSVEVKTVYAPAWTTAWITEEAREKLRLSGIAPPPPVGSPEDAPVNCPYCGSTDTDLRSIFGCTACKSLHFCKACQQPFEGFKAI